ncbi:sugar kinase [Limnohabitans sp.]|jgi:2-dehydro-3-deoxygluconokinase|uniref:sugar kinase n=1 Tax=Limnohabitans sp. TaxID=1907725 RepID=UPI0037BFC16E
MGEALVEYNQNERTQQRHFLQGFGGDTSNFLVAAARQGSRVAYLSALGSDGHANLLRQMWTDEGVCHEAVATHPQAPTGVYFVRHTHAGHQFDFLRGGSAASLMRPGALDCSLLSATRAFHFSGISMAISATACDAVLLAAQQAREHGALVSFDTNLRKSLWPLARARAMSREAMALCDICLPSWDDITELTGLSEPQAILDHCLGLGAKVVALKMGAQGAWVAQPGARLYIPAFKVDAVDATGAGDTFGGVFVSQWLRQPDLREAGRYACAAAALSTQGYGAIHPIPHRQQVQHLLQASP